MIHEPSITSVVPKESSSALGTQSPLFNRPKLDEVGEKLLAMEVMALAFFEKYDFLHPRERQC